MLWAAGATGDIADQIKNDLHICGCNFSTGHYDLLPSPSVEELEDLKNNLRMSMDNQKNEILRLQSRRPETDGRAAILEHTHKEQKMGKFEPELGEP